ncbi:MAG TPA: hypothetical protein VFU02_02205 [Polyangiaceae bacterium]|nr:hypothetical protein [Polyangiaceae bacterium]
MSHLWPALEHGTTTTQKQLPRRLRNSCYEALMRLHPSLESLKDDALLCQFAGLVRQDREGNANLLRHIDTIDRRRL